MSNQGKRLSILSLPEVQDVYRTPKFDAQEQRRYFTFTDEELATAKRIRLLRNRIHFLLMLGYFSAKPVTLVSQWRDIKADYFYIAHRYYPAATKQKKNIDRQTRRRLYQLVFGLMDYQHCDNTIAFNLFEHLQQRARQYVDETQLFKDAINYLNQSQVAIPRYYLLQQLISKAINTEETRLSKLVHQHLKNKNDFLKFIQDKQSKMGLNELKKLAKTLKFGENKKEQQRHNVISELYPIALAASKKMNLSSSNIQYFASRCLQYDIHQLNRLKPEKALIYLICFVIIRFQQSNDNLIQSFLVCYKNFNDQSIDYQHEKQKEYASAMAESLEKVPTLLNLYIDDTLDNELSFGHIRETVFEIIAKDKLKLVTQKLANVTLDKKQLQWEYIDQQAIQIERTLKPLLLVLSFGFRNNRVLEKTVNETKKALRKNEVPPSIDARLIKASDKKYLIDDTTDADKKVIIQNRQRYYLYRLIDQGIRQGDIFIENSLENRSFDDYLVNDTVWSSREQHLSDAGLSWMIEDPDDHLTCLAKTLEEKLTSVGQRIESGKNNYIQRQGNSDKLHWSKAVIAKDPILTEKFFTHFDRETIVSIIRRVNEETQFMAHLKPSTKRNKKAVVTLEYLLACLIGNGTFQGTYRFASLSDQSYRILKRIELDCFHPEALRLASDQLMNRALELSIFDDFNLADGNQHSSADGQRFESQYLNSLVDYSAKHYGKKKGAIVYTLVASHFAVEGKVMSARSHESHHLFDVVHNNTSDLKAPIVSTDTHGVNPFNYAILNTFGYQFTPRYAGFKKRFLAEFTVNFEQKNSLELDKPINWKLIRSQWDNIVKIMLSLSMRTVQQSTLVKKTLSL